MKLRVGLVGLGDMWLTRHRPALKALSDRFEVCAICCEVAHRAQQAATEFGAVSVDGFRTMIMRNDIDAVLALATDWAGPLPILAACDAGKAVYSSAALDIAPNQVNEIRRRVDESGVAFMAELPRRHAPATLRLKELIATRLGKPKLLFCHERLSTEQQTDRLRRGDYCPLKWRHMMELVDWSSFLVDANPISVLSAQHRYGDEASASSYAMINLEYESDSGEENRPVAQISVGHYIPESWKEALTFRRPASIQVCCENGIAFVELPSTLIWFDGGGQHTESLELDRPVGEQLLTHFHRAVTSLVRKTSDLADAYRAMMVMLAANDSAQKGERIAIDLS